LPDQWMSHILIRILNRARVIYISNMPDNTVKEMHLIPADSLESAITKAKELIGKENIKITAIPDGVAVMVK